MSRRDRLQPLQVYQLLPRTNCKLCGCEGCFAFAFALLSREKRLADCPELQSEAFATTRRKLQGALGKAEIIEGTGLALDYEKCNGCGDCVVVCNKAITAINPRDGTLSYRKNVAPVLQVIDGVVHVINWSSCKRMMDTPDYCRVCEEKCLFGALELVG